MSFDKLAALYVYCMNYHTGQWSREYRIMSRIIKQYKLKLTDNAIANIEDESDYSQNVNTEWLDAHFIYMQLVANHTTI